MKRNLLKEIENRMSSFSKGQKLIANYIIEHYEKAAYMTAAQLGSLVNVSESTVVRFAIDLGYKGYPEMQLAVQELVKIKLDRHLGGDRKSVFVGVNGHIFQVPTGKVVEVSAPIAERLEMMKVQMEVLDDIRDGIPNEGN